ncbi:MAG: hypothetical protein NT062_25680 [Proteobacteria bacterium]|nr:hypothetical protein [Pseudomonadota bacterium]
MREFVERIATRAHEQRYLVRRPDGTLRTTWTCDDPDDDWLAQTQRDVAAIVGFRHPRVFEVYEVRRDPGGLVVELADDRGPQFPLAAAQLTGLEREGWVVAQIIALCDALGELAARLPTFVHAHLEPDNVVVDATGRARLRPMLWPRVRAPRRATMGAGQITRTVGWLSPEQVRGMLVGPASDVFSLATLLHAAIAGHAPFSGDGDMMTSLVNIIEGRRAPLALATPGLDGVLARAFAVDAAARFATPAAFGTALYACMPDAADYDLVTSDRLVEWWPSSARVWDESEVLDVRCAKTWGSLAPRADDPDVRDCGTCQQSVVRVTSLAAAVPLVGRRCIAYRP